MPTTTPVFHGCTIKHLPADRHAAAAATAIRQNPVNAPNGLHYVPSISRIAVLTSKYWGAAGIKLSVSFLDNPETALRKRIVSHMNAWSRKCHVSFHQVAKHGQVRIARAADGYWSYLGTDILEIPPDEPTMNLEGFTMQTPESEYRRVVRHETGHTLGAPHEHMRAELVSRIDPAKAYAYFQQSDGWDRATVDAQVLTAVDANSIMGTPNADQSSIMCYQLPGSITKDGQPILGGTDIDATDFAFMSSIYPKPKRLPPAPKVAA
jgi:hypothetical protein